jgi:hypothetical protein
VCDLKQTHLSVPRLKTLPAPAMPTRPCPKPSVRPPWASKAGPCRCEKRMTRLPGHLNQNLTNR